MASKRVRYNMETPNTRVLEACLALLANLDCDMFRDSPYCLPYMNYVMTWPYALPIKTIIIGQNPYPQSIYPEIGAALSYDPSKVKAPPASIRVIAEDLFNYNATPRTDTISCFRDLWSLSDRGIIALNETVFSKIVDSVKDSNLRPIREVEFQIRTLQVMIGESHAMGQRVINCVGMGISAAMMASTLKGWCPNDLVTLRVSTCPNPAAFAYHIGDLQSQCITLGKLPVSKILFSIVQEYITMAPNQQNQSDKRIQQNIESLRSASTNVASSNTSIRNEYSSFVERLKLMKIDSSSKVNVDDIIDCASGIVEATDKHAIAVQAHTMSMIMVANAIQQRSSKTDSALSQLGTVSSTGPSPVMTPQSTPARVPRRVVRRSETSHTIPSSEISTIQTIDENKVMSPIATPVQTTAPPVSSTVPEPRTVSTPARRTRRVVKTPSRAPSVADTEYTTTDGPTTATPKIGSKETLAPVEQVHMRSFAAWFMENMEGDTTFSQMLEMAANDGVMSSEFTRRVLSHIRTRISEDRSYDAYEELAASDAVSRKWCDEYAAELLKAK